MNALEAAVLVALVLLPFHILLQRELARLCSARHITQSGVALERDEALEARGEVIGRYDDAPIYAWVKFMGMRYRFDRVAPNSYRDRVRNRELFVRPGLVYLTD